MKASLGLRVGPAAFRIGSDWRGPIDALRSLYADYPQLSPQGSRGLTEWPGDALTVRIEAASPLRRFVARSVAIGGDHVVPEAAPLPYRLALLAAEMGMNLQVALGWRRHLLVHAASVEQDGRALLLPGDSGSGKSTLAVMLAQAGWRFMGDEFAMLGLEDGALHPFPRPASLKGGAAAWAAGHLPPGRLGPLLPDTPKGDVRHVVPDPAALAAMDRPAMPFAIVFPRFGADAAVRPVGPAEAFVRLTEASTNYVALGERGFDALTRLVRAVPALAIDYPDGETALAMVAELLR